MYSHFLFIIFLLFVIFLANYLNTTAPVLVENFVSKSHIIINLNISALILNKLNIIIYLAL